MLGVLHLYQELSLVWHAVNFGYESLLDVMSRHVSKLGRKQEDAIAALLSQRNLDEAARTAPVAHYDGAIRRSWSRKRIVSSPRSKTARPRRTNWRADFRVV